jgi:phosphocarrier protein HPr
MFFCTARFTEMDVSTAEVQIQNMMGIHLRPASSLVQICNRYPDCEVALTKDGQTVNGKSIMSVVMLAAEQGSSLKIEVTGNDSEQLLADLVNLIDGKFGEE